VRLITDTPVSSPNVNGPFNMLHVHFILCSFVRSICSSSSLDTFAVQGPDHVTQTVDRPNTHTHTHTHTHNRLTAFVRDNPGRPVPEKNTHPLTPILIIGRPLSSSSIYNDPWHPLCSFYVFDNLLRQSLSRSSLDRPNMVDKRLHTKI